MIFQCSCCEKYFSNPVERKTIHRDPRGWGYSSWVDHHEYCPYCGGDELEFYNSLIEYDGKYFQDEIDLERTLEEMGYTPEKIENALKEATKIWEVE